MNVRKFPSLLAALFLQLAPLVRVAEPMAAGMLQPVFVLLRWLTAATAVAGGAHALSGATGLLSASAVRGTNGVPLSYRTEIFSDEYGKAQSYSATGLPPGLRIVSRTAGTIGVTPTAAGVFPAKVTGWKETTPGGDKFYTATVTFTIVDSPPVITTPPQTRTVAVGGSVTLSVEATGSSLTYRWLKGDLEVPGGTGPSLVLDPVKLSDAGLYRVRVGNTGGTILSDPAELVVLAPSLPVIESISGDRTVHEGELVQLSVTASSPGPDPGPPAIAWFRAGVESPVGNAALLDLGAAVPSILGEYRAVATSSGNSVTSAPVSVRVVPPLSLGQAGLDPQSSVFRFSAGTIPGRKYFFEGAFDLAPESWTLIREQIVPGELTEFTDPVGAESHRLYRLRVE